MFHRNLNNYFYSEKNKKNIETKTGSKFSLKGYLCIATIQSKQFETDSLTQKPTKSRSIFFAYVNAARKIGKLLLH